MLKLKFQYFDHLMRRVMLGGAPRESDSRRLLTASCCPLPGTVRTTLGSPRLALFLSAQ